MQGSGNTPVTPLDTTAGAASSIHDEAFRPLILAAECACAAAVLRGEALQECPHGHFEPSRLNDFDLSLSWYLRLRHWRLVGIA